MADDKKKKSRTERWAERGRKKGRTKSEDVPGRGMARDAARKLEEARRRRQDILDGL